MITAGFIIIFISLLIAANYIEDRFSKLERRVGELESRTDDIID